MGQQPNSAVWETQTAQFDCSPMDVRGFTRLPLVRTTPQKILAKWRSGLPERRPSHRRLCRPHHSCSAVSSSGDPMHELNEMLDAVPEAQVHDVLVGRAVVKTF